MNADLESYFDPEQKTLLVDSVLHDFKTWLITQGATSNTVRAYNSRVKQYLLFLKYAGFVEQEVLKESQAFVEAAESYRNFLKQSDMSARSVNAAMIALNSFARFLGLEYLSVEREPSRIKPGRLLSQDEQQRFLKSVERQKSSRDRALALLLFHTGIKLGDCASLHAADVSICKKPAKVLLQTGPDAKDPTAGMSERVKDLTNENLVHSYADHGIETQSYGYVQLRSGSRVPLNDSAAMALNQWLVEHASIVAGNKEPALWVNANGKKLSIPGIDFVVRRIGWQARLVLSCQVLRRTCLDNAARNVSKPMQAAQFGEYVSPTTMGRFGSSSSREHNKLADTSSCDL